MKKSLTDAIISIVVYMLLAVFLMQMGKVPAQAKGYPTFLLAASALINTVLFVKSVLQIRKEEPSAPPPGGRSVIVGICSYAAMLAAYIFLIPKISYIASTVLFSFASLKFLKVKSWPVLILLPFCMTLLVYFAFTRILMVSLPIGTWFYIDI